MAKSLLLKGVLITALVLVLVHVFSASYFLALIIVATLGVFGEIWTYPDRHDAPQPQTEAISKSPFVHRNDDTGCEIC